jgi:Abnormal spindle-like microcephaly-assoc'd, ASPM-SPD-2-Hydin
LQLPTPDGSHVAAPQVVTQTAITVDSAGALYVAGSAPLHSTDDVFTNWMPPPVTLGAFQTTPGVAFVMKLTPNASGLDYATYIDGTPPVANTPSTTVAGVAVDSTGEAFVAGSTPSSTFPTTPGAYQTSGLGAFVMELNPNGTAPVYSTFFSGLSQASGIAIDSHGQAVLTGLTFSTVPVTPNALCSGNASPGGFVAKFTADGSGLVYATTLCGPSSDAASVAVDSTGAAYVVGTTDYPATFQPILLHPIQGYPPTLPDVVNVAVKLDTSGNLQWSTFLGLNYPAASPSNSKIAVDGTGAAYIFASSGIPPTPNSVGPAAPPFTQGSPNPVTSDLILKIAPSLGAPVPVVSPGQVSFVSQNVGTASTAVDVQVANFGDAPMSPGISITGDFSETDNCSVAVPSGQKCDVNMVFTPSAAGPRTGTLTVSFGGNIPSQTVALSGNGGAPAVTLSPTSLSFGVQATGTTSGAQQITVANTGTGPLTISAAQTSSQFASTSTCGAPVAPSSSCMIQVTFTPTASGTQLGTLTIADKCPEQSPNRSTHRWRASPSLDFAVTFQPFLQ